MFVTHGARPSRGNGKKRKGVDEYAAENWEDFVPKSMIREGQPTRVLVCRFCCLSVGARSDRIKEHLASKRHNKMKLEHFKALPEAEAGQEGREEREEDGEPAAKKSPPPSSSSSRNSSGTTGSGGGATEDFGENGVGDLWSSTTSSSGSYRSTSSSPRHPSSSSPSEQLLNVKWNHYGFNLTTEVSSMLRDEQFVDVTLICEGKAIKCHRMVLAACSPYFETFFKVMPNPSVVVISDIKFWELEALVEFMYSGEVEGGQDQLQDLFRAAEIYQVSGLRSSTQSLLQMMNDTSGNDDMTATPTTNTDVDYQASSDNDFHRSSSRGPPPPYHSYHHGVNGPAETNGINYPMMGIDMTTRKTALEPTPPTWDLNGDNSSTSRLLSSSGNGILDGGGGDLNRKRKKVTGRAGNLVTPRGVPPLLPILPFFNPHQNSMGALNRDNAATGLKLDMRQSQYEWGSGS